MDLHRHPFRFQAVPTWEIREQSIPQHLLYLILGGSCSAILEGQRFLLTAGQFCWINPGARFCLASRGMDDLPTLCRFRFSVQRGILNFRLPWKFRVGDEALDMLEWARALVAEAERPGPFAVDRMKSLAVLIAVHVFEQGRVQKAKESSKLARSLCDRLMRMVAEHPEKRYTPPQLARECGLSSDYFTRLFRNSFGIPPKEWLLKQRLRSASALLSESDSRVSEIAQQLGYEDLYLFSRQFRKEFGSSPRAWRRAHSMH